MSSSSHGWFFFIPHSNVAEWYYACFCCWQQWSRLGFESIIKITKKIMQNHTYHLLKPSAVLLFTQIKTHKWTHSQRLCMFNINKRINIYFIYKIKHFHDCKYFMTIILKADNNMQTSHTIWLIETKIS